MKYKQVYLKITIFWNAFEICNTLTVYATLNTICDICHKYTIEHMPKNRAASNNCLSFNNNNCQKCLNFLIYD